MARGGKRKGAGRPRSSKKITISVAMDQEFVEKIDIEAGLHNQSRSELVQIAVEAYLKNAIPISPLHNK